MIRPLRSSFWQYLQSLRLHLLVGLGGGVFSGDSRALTS